MVPKSWRSEVIEIATFVLVLVAVVLLAAVATPHLFPLAAGAGLVREDGFLKVFRRLLMIGSIVAVAAVFRPWRDASLADHGLRDFRSRISYLASGYAIGILAISSVLWWSFSAGFLAWRDEIDWQRVAVRAATYLVGGLLLSIIEEYVFRGWMYRRASSWMPPAVAAIITALVFAFVHAFKPERLKLDVDHTAGGALTAFREWTLHGMNVEKFGWMFIGLFVVSLVLTIAYRTTGTLWTAIGLHGGAVLTLYTYGSMTIRLDAPRWAGTRAIFDGAPLWIVMSAIGFALVARAFVRKRSVAVSPVEISPATPSR